MSFFDFLNNWWNFPFLVMLGLVLVYFTLQLVGLAGHHGKEVDAGPHDHDVDHDADADHGGEHLEWGDILSWFGVGRVPLMVVWCTLFIFAGFTGLFLNRVMVAQRPYPWWFFPIALATALVVGLIAVRLFSRVAARLVDVGGKGSTAKHELAGKVGVVASARLDEKFGEVRVRDGAGNEMIVHGRVEKGAKPLAQGSRVVLVDFDPQGELFWVAESPDVDVNVK